MKYIIETKNLTKKYGNNISVNQLDLKIPEKSIYGFLGPNGAGKSTTMKMLLDLVKPDDGEIIILNHNLNSKNRIEILKHTGSLIESPSYYGHLSGQENLEIVALLKGTSKSEIDEVLKIVRLEKQRSKKVDHYSLGMKQRLGIAMALLGKPKLLLLDEPTNGLDPSGIQEIRELICSLPDRYGMTVLISSHLLSEIDQMATHVGIIDNGELVFQDSMSCLQAHSQKSIWLHTLDDNNAFMLLSSRNLSLQKCDEGILFNFIEDQVIAELIQYLVRNDIGILRVEERHKSLEEIFLSITGRRMSL